MLKIGITVKTSNTREKNTLNWKDNYLSAGQSVKTTGKCKKEVSTLRQKRRSFPADMHNETSQHRERERERERERLWVKATTDQQYNKSAWHFTTTTNQHDILQQQISMTFYNNNRSAWHFTTDQHDILQQISITVQQISVTVQQISVTVQQISVTVQQISVTVQTVYRQAWSTTPQPVTMRCWNSLKRNWIHEWMHGWMTWWIPGKY